MLGLRRMVLGETTRSVVMTVIYLGFFFIMLRSVLAEPSWGGKVFYLLLMVVFGGFSLLSEYLRWLYRKAIKTLIIHCKPQEAIAQMAALQKADLLRGYRNAAVVFHTLTLIDRDCPRELLDYVDGEAYKTLACTPDLRLVYYYCRFYANFMLGDAEAMEEPYQELQKLRFAKGRKNKVAPIYNWELIDGDYRLTQGDPSRAKKCYEQIPVDNLNNRERAHFYLSRALAAGRLGHPREEEKYLKYAREVAPDLPRVQHYQPIAE